jgi:hypothetical protein
MAEAIYMGRDELQQNAAPPTMPSVAQERALASLLGGASVTAAAKAAEVDRATLHRWLSDDATFIAAFNSYRVEMADALRQEIRFLGAEAVRTLRSLLTGEETPAAIRLKAASEVLKLTLGEPLNGPTSVEDAEAAMARRGLDRRIGRRPDRLV